MARDTDLCGRSKQLARLPWITIPLAQMDAICPKPFGQVHAIIDDKRYIAVGADTLQRFGCASDNMLVNAFKTELEGRDRAGIKGRSQRSEEHTSELQSQMRNASAVSCLQKQ